MKKIILGKIIGPQGPQGEKGEQGIQGIQGIQGPQGEKGSQGIQGEQGYRGSRWNLGTAIEGIFTEPKVCIGTGLNDSLINDYYFNPNTGHLYRCTDAGDTTVAKWVWWANLKGLQGPQGEQGPQGIQGERGPRGFAGSTGPKGDTGATGATGAQGPKGDTGATGATGAQGPKGDKGDPGNKAVLLCGGSTGGWSINYDYTGIIYEELLVFATDKTNGVFLALGKYKIFKNPGSSRYYCELLSESCAGGTWAEQGIKAESAYNSNYEPTGFKFTIYDSNGDRDSNKIFKAYSLVRINDESTS